MKSRIKLIAQVTGISIFLLAGIARAEDFSADMVSTSQGLTSSGKIFISNDKVRMEVPGAITISRMDKKVVWMLMPKDKMYMEQPFDPSKAVASSEKVSGEVERKLLGKETVDGRMADKYMIVYNVNGRKESIYQWIAPGIKMPVKTAAVDNSWVMEYKNIKTGKQPDSLFEVPAGYQKFSYSMPSVNDVLGGLGE